MKYYSNTVKFSEGVSLGGYADRVHQRTSKPGYLEINGFSVNSDDTDFEVCSIDALYAGELANRPEKSDSRIIAASHTHYAPMLDRRKASLGVVDDACVKIFTDGLRVSENINRHPDLLEIYTAEVDVPVYRRFDYPESQINGCLTRYGGSFPNDVLAIDKSVKILVFSEQGSELFAIAYHACHPVSRGNSNEISADYVGPLREAIRSRFGVDTCLFFQGCAGDIRPNVARKRVGWLPKSRLNWRFDYQPGLEKEQEIDGAYRASVERAERLEAISITENAFTIRSKNIHFEGDGDRKIRMLDIGRQVSFAFIPFEVSHLYHMELQSKFPEQYKLIVSCAGDTSGYLPHPSQLSSSGYEVDRSRDIMNLKNRVSFNAGDLW